MSQTERISFRRNLRGFLGSSWLSRTLPASRLAGTSKSLSADPVEPIDAVFTTVTENYESQDHLAGFQSVTRQVLASDVLDSLIQLQSEMATFDDMLQVEPESLSAKAAHAYRRAQENFENENPSLLWNAS